MDNMKIPEFQGNLRSFMLKVPEIIRECSGIKIFGKKIRSVLFSTDVSIIRNTNADAVIAVYPFTPQPIITQAVMTASDIPVDVYKRQFLCRALLPHSWRCSPYCPA